MPRPGMLLRWHQAPAVTMSSHSRLSRAGLPAAELPTEAWDYLDQVLARFEAAWRGAAAKD